jgi:hypothetical protein
MIFSLKIVFLKWRIRHYLTCLPHFLHLGWRSANTVVYHSRLSFLRGPQKLNSFFALLTVPLGFLVAQKILLFLLSTLICSELFFVQQKLIGLLSTLHDFVRCPFNDFVYRTLLTVPLGFFVAQKILPCLPFIFNMLRVVFCPTKYLKATVNTKTIFCTRI